MGQREDFVAKARAEIGTVEVPENLTKYGKFTGHDGQPWCGSFCMWVAHETSVKIPNTVYTPSGVEAFKASGHWQDAGTATPQPGDIVYFDFVKGGAEVEHVGIVVKDNLDGSVVTVEGNTSSDKKPAGSQANGGEVAMKVRAYKADNKRKLPVFIVGFGKTTFK
jgi:hypothetical protein